MRKSARDSCFCGNSDDPRIAWETCANVRLVRERILNGEMDFPWTDSKRFSLLSKVFKGWSRIFHASGTGEISSARSQPRRGPALCKWGARIYVSSLAPHKLPGVEQGLMGRWPFRRCNAVASRVPENTLSTDTTCRALRRIGYFRSTSVMIRAKEKSLESCELQTDVVE